MTQDDPQVPGANRWQEAALAFVSGTLSIGLMGVVAHVARAPFVFPSLGPTAFLLFYRPKASASSPRNTIVGHLVGAGCGLGALAVFGLLGQADAFSTGITWPRAGAAALSLGATGGLMVGLRVPHPPAGATTLIVSLGLMTALDQLVVLMLAVTLLVLQAWATHRVAGTPYPTWSPLPGSHSSTA